jgi:uncharacterized membrane protein
MVRSVTWRLIAVIVSVGVAYWYTHSISVAAQVSVTYNAIQIFLHYFHDRVWARVGWGTRSFEGSEAIVGRPTDS